MTIQELSQLFCLEELINRQKEMVDRLRESADVKSPSFSDTPKAPGAHDRIGDVVPDIADLCAEMQETLAEYTAARERILRYINRIPNARIKLIMILRFVDRLPWESVADRVGGGETGGSARMAVVRYLERENSYAADS